LPLIALMSANRKRAAATFAGEFCGRNLRTMRINI
jgi:hypothetical protein